MKSENSFEFDGDLIIVSAVVVGPSGQADVRLVLDTGAALTTLVPRIAESIGYTSAARVARNVIRSAVAEEHGYIVRLARLSTLGFTVPDAHADVADLGHGIDGVLGMSFLSDFNFEIRPGERLILVEGTAPR
jgi:clan AA aspartic protease (TIGR02281 family)